MDPSNVNKPWRAAVALAVTLAPFLGSAFAGDIGDAAPPLDIAEWVKGGAVDLAAGKGNQIYVVEFWATWCPPCRASVPHLTEMQKKYKDKGLTIIGISDEPVAVVRPFVDKQADKMEFTVAVDRDRATYARYMNSFGVKGIPHAFIIDLQGRVAWHGHPMSGMDEVLERLVEKSGGKRFVELREKYFAAAEDGKKGPELARLANDYVEACANNLAALCEFGTKLRELEPSASEHHQAFLNVARAAVKVSKGQDALANELLAESWFRAGNAERAVRYAKLALRPKQDDEDKQRRSAALERYAAAAPKAAGEPPK